MNRLKEASDLSLAARWRLAAAYQLAGRPETAQALSRGASTEVAAYSELSNTFGSELRDKAMILETLHLLGENNRAAPVAKQLSEALSGERWLSTQTAAFALVAMARYAQMVGSQDDLRFTYRFAGGKEVQVSSQAPVVERKLEVNHGDTAAIELSNKGSGDLFPRIIVSGIPKAGKERSAEQNMRLSVSYRLPGGESLDPTAIDQGTDFIAEVKVDNTGVTGRYEEVALSHLLPSGWEIHNERMDPSQSSKQSSFEYRDIRDDRVYTYFDLDRGGSKTFTVLLNASYLGKYYLPMVAAEAMYDATISARQKGRWIEVTRPGG